MQTLELKASTRAGIGKSVTRKMRAQGILPATLYGPATEPMNLQVSTAAFEDLYVGRESSNFILNLQVDDQEPMITLIRERQKHPVSGAMIHVDFQRIRMDRPINIEIPIVLTGESDGVKTFGGIQEHLMRSVEISCLPTHIPDRIVVDVSKLGINDSVHIGDITIENVEILGDSGRPIVNIAPPRLSTELDEEAEGVEGEAAEGETEAEGETPAAGDGDAAGKD